MPMSVENSDDDSDEVFQTTLRRVLIATVLFSAALALARVGFADNRPECAIAALLLTLASLFAIFRRPMVAFAFLPVIVLAGILLFAVISALMVGRK